jgi:beta-N-acetylhexosaminidase
MLVVGLEGPELLPSEAQRFKQGERAGVVLFRRNLGATMASVARLIASLVDVAPNALVAVDQEGGRVARLGAPALTLPPMRVLGDLDDEALVRRVAAAQARELKALGFTMNFAPVADVHTRHDNPIIGDRAFATTPERVARFAGAYAAGLADGGVLACAKHFPGHGDTDVDSHLALPCVSHPEARLLATEVAPFAALARDTASVAAMMTAHVLYPALDSVHPATLSHAISTVLLRERLGFKGVLFSDDLEMKALTMPIEQSSVQAVLAGCDVLLVCADADLADAAHAALVREAETSPAFRARCEEAAARSLAMRESQRSTPMRNADDASLTRVFARSISVSAELQRRCGGAS